MEQEIRKKTFRGAKIEDVILELDKLSSLCQEKSKSSDQLERHISMKEWLLLIQLLQ
ncbi:hypothetical protein [Bacillus canaveralius]|uniref:hypothetical protein n=1 Tax=Bacillus canaveralius TaxID=1403243 RepID=UPI0026A7828F|nr:hypothetical protein [Bacillus canaveralius]